jgi:hypothetical protein
MTCDKTQYSSQGEAKAAANGLSKRGKSSMYAYQCERCGKWHLATAGKKKTPPYKKPKYKML